MAPKITDLERCQNRTPESMASLIRARGGDGGRLRIGAVTATETEYAAAMRDIDAWEAEQAVGKIDVEVSRKDGRITISAPEDLYAMLLKRRRRDGTITPAQFGEAFDEWRKRKE